MITWMQRHKKWLVVTIWISTIAFVGAGFVGWGSYDYGKSDGAIAKVGNKEIPLNDLQSEYNFLYSQYSQMFGNNFNQEMAKQFKLEDAAFQKVVQKYLLLNYADQYGLIATDEDVAKKLLRIEAFQKDGKFDKETYISVLKQNRKSPADFEKQLKNDIVIQKVQNIFQFQSTNSELENLSNLLNIEDKVEAKLITIDNEKIDLTTEQINEFYEKNKENYKSQAGYNVEFTKIENIKDKDEKEMKKVALKEYLALKKGETTFATQQTIYATNHFLNNEDFEELIKSNPNDVLKPFYANGNYYVFKYISKQDPQILPLEDVINQVKSDLKNERRSLLLDTKISSTKENFKGIDLGYISNDSNITLKGLNQDEINQFKNAIFGSKATMSEIKFGSKAVVFKITDSRFKESKDDLKASIKPTIDKIKTNEIIQNLITSLQNKYEVKSFIGSN
ncbi:MAG: peptidylprolyl isomerase [Campylobacterales bacterium]|nr:peptidylprolyl isomerase [Campylobacterales bacterium]